MAVVQKNEKWFQAIPMLFCGLLLMGAGCTADQTQSQSSGLTYTDSTQNHGGLYVPDSSASSPPAATQPVTPVTPPPACKHSPEFKFSSTDEARLKEITGTALHADGTLTPEMHQEFWSIMDSYGVMCDEDLKLTRDGMTAIAVCRKLFYEDALQSVRMGQAYKSPQRSACDDNTIRALLSPEKAEARIGDNEALMEKIAAGAPISTANGVLTQERIQATLDGMIDGLDRANQLFMR